MIVTEGGRGNEGELMIQEAIGWKNWSDWRTDRTYNKTLQLKTKEGPGFSLLVLFCLGFCFVFVYSLFYMHLTEKIIFHSDFQKFKNY